MEVSSEGPDGLAGPSAWSSEVLEEWLLEHARAISPTDVVDPRTDLFAQGFDRCAVSRESEVADIAHIVSLYYSLSVTYLRNRILGALRKSSDPEVKKAAPHIPPNVIFENPTIRLLSSRIAALVNDNGAGHGVDFIEQHEQAINAMIEKYSVGLDGPVDGVLPSTQLVEPAVILLTGSTGGLGSFLLSELLKSPAVQHVFAFNRPSSTKSIEERQKWAFRDRGLEIDLLDSNKLVYVEADASLEKCGLSPAQYEEVGLTLGIVKYTITDMSSADSEFCHVDHTQRVAPRFQFGNIFL